MQRTHVYALAYRGFNSNGRVGGLGCRYRRIGSCQGHFLMLESKVSEGEHWRNNFWICWINFYLISAEVFIQFLLFCNAKYHGSMRFRALGYHTLLLFRNVSRVDALLYGFYRDT